MDHEELPTYDSIFVEKAIHNQTPVVIHKNFYISCLTRDQCAQFIALIFLFLTAFLLFSFSMSFPSNPKNQTDAVPIKILRLPTCKKNNTE